MKLATGTNGSSAPGFFESDSVAWSIHGDASAAVGGIRSLLVQALQPRAMAAVAGHGGFDADFWGRLQRTSTFLMTVVYGSRDEAEEQASVVRAVHRRISGVDSFTGRAYRADEPELLLWVHNATVESHLVAYQRYGRRLTTADADQYVREMEPLARLVGYEGELPESVRELRAYFDAVDAELAVSPEASAGARRLLRPNLPGAVQPLWVVPAAAAVASLPRRYQRRYGLPPLTLLAPGVRVAASAMLTGLRILLPPPPIVEAARRARPA